MLEARRRRQARIISARPRSVWAEQAQWLIATLAIATIIGVGSIPTPETVTGTAIIHDSRIRAVHSPVDGAVTAVFVEPGDEVALGEPLMALRDPVVEVDYRGTQRRVEQALVARLRARSSLDGPPVRELVDELARARARADLYTVRADAAGIVSGVRLQVGEEVRARAVLATIREHGEGELLAIVDIPANAAEKVEVGAKVLIAFGEGRRSEREFEVVARSAEALSVPVDERGRAGALDNRLRFWARYVDARDELPPPHPGVQGRAELVYRSRSLFGALLDIVIGERP